MSDQDPGSHDSPYREREDNDANKDPSEQDNEYYQFLHISRQATEAEIHTAYKKLSLLYHPDKHLDEEKKKKAEILFQKLKKAYEGRIKILAFETDTFREFSFSYFD